MKAIRKTGNSDEISQPDDQEPGSQIPLDHSEEIDVPRERSQDFEPLNEKVKKYEQHGKDLLSP